MSDLVKRIDKIVKGKEDKLIEQEEALKRQLKVIKKTQEVKKEKE